MSMCIFRILYVSLTVGLLFSHSEARCDEPSGLSRHAEVARRITAAGLGTGQAHALLSDLCATAPHRLSGSEGAKKAVEWGRRTLKASGLTNVRLEPVMVPHWVRGSLEEASMVLTGANGSVERVPLKVCALGGSVSTPAAGITAEVVAVQSFEELRALGEKARGKIIFFNRAFDRSLFSPFAAYGGAVGQRGSGAVEAAKAGGVAALVRSMTSRRDDVPHTGGMRYDGGVTQVPAAAISILGAERLADQLRHNPHLKVELKLSCETLPDAPSANVVGELVGSERPSEVIVIGGHLDCWDKGQGAHDDGAGCVHAIEALRLLNELGIRPKRTIRVVLFMNEENGNRGGEAYAAAARPGEIAVAAIESDAGGFMPRGFGVGGGNATFEAVAKWAPLLAPIEADRLVRGGHGVDIGPLVAKGVPGFGLNVDNQRYFDYHHSDNDTIDKVNERELELGAIAMAIMSYMIAEEGLPVAAKR
jgi:Zn-dependent M28 family amino/carboxypeptidase